MATIYQVKKIYSEIRTNVLKYKHSSVENNEVAVVLVNGYEATLKRIKKSESGITLISDNTNYSPSTYTHPGEVTIVGKVVEVRRKL